MTGYSREQVERRELTWRTMTPQGGSRSAKNRWNASLKPDRIGPYVKEYRLHDDTLRWMLFAGRDLGDGTICEYCIDITDIQRDMGTSNFERLSDSD